MFNSKKKKEKGPNETKPADPTKRKRRDSLSLVRRMGTEKAKPKPRKDMHNDSSTNIGPGAVENSNSRESLEDHEPSPRVVEFSDSPSRPTPPRATVTMSEVCLSTKYYEDDKIVQDEDEQATLNRARSFKIRDERRMAELADFANNHVGKGVVSQATFGKDLSDGLVFLHLLYKLTGQMPRIYSQNPKYQIQKVDNIHVVLRILATQYRLQEKYDPLAIARGDVFACIEIMEVIYKHFNARRRSSLGGVLKTSKLPPLKRNREGEGSNDERRTGLLGGGNDEDSTFNPPAPNRIPSSPHLITPRISGPSTPSTAAPTPRPPPANYQYPQIGPVTPFKNLQRKKGSLFEFQEDDDEKAQRYLMTLHSINCEPLSDEDAEIRRITRKLTLGKFALEERVEDVLHSRTPSPPNSSSSSSSGGSLSSKSGFVKKKANYFREKKQQQGQIMGVSKGKALIDLWGIGVGNECVCAADGWKVEQAVAGAPMAAFTHQLRPEQDTKGFKDLMKGDDDSVQHWVSTDPDRPMIVSIQKKIGENELVPSIIRYPVGTKISMIRHSSKEKTLLRRVGVPEDIKFRLVKKSLNRHLRENLIKLDDRDFRFQTHLTVGVLYRAKGQNEDNELYQNVDGSPQFQKFLELLGDRIKLLGWENFRGGLDVKETASTGTESIFTTHHEKNKVMFHVSTLLPYTPGCDQQVGRKRHIGNDLVVILFQDTDCEAFDASTVKSHMNHTYIVVRPVPRPSVPLDPRLRDPSSVSSPPTLTSSTSSSSLSTAAKDIPTITTSASSSNLSQSAASLSSPAGSSTLSLSSGASSAQPSPTEKGAKSERSERSEKSEKPEKSEKSEKSEREKGPRKRSKTGKTRHKRSTSNAATTSSANLPISTSSEISLGEDPPKDTPTPKRRKKTKRSRVSSTLSVSPASSPRVPSPATSPALSASVDTASLSVPSSSDASSLCPPGNSSPVDREKSNSPAPSPSPSPSLSAAKSLDEEGGEKPDYSCYDDPEDGVFYEVAIIAKEGVPLFTPYLHTPSVFPNNAYFRNFFLTKLVNACRATLEAPAFERKIIQAQTELLKIFIQEIDPSIKSE